MITTINEFRKTLNESSWYGQPSKEQRLKEELKDLRMQLKNLFDDQDLEAGQKGDQWNDDDGNRYGALMNKIEDKIDRKEAELDKYLNTPFKSRATGYSRTEKPETNLIRTLRKQLPEIETFVQKYQPTWTEMNLPNEEIVKAFTNRFGITNEPSDVIIAALTSIGVLK